jgi:hypothetical protein
MSEKPIGWGEIRFTYEKVFWRLYRITSGPYDLIDGPIFKKLVFGLVWRRAEFGQFKPISFSSPEGEPTDPDNDEEDVDD